MTSGELRERVTFSSRGSDVADDFGNVETSFVDRLTVAARIRPRLGGSEAVAAARLEGRALASIRIRYSTAALAITTDWLATDARTGEVWNIKSPPVNVDEKKAYLEMLVEKVPSGP